MANLLCLLLAPLFFFLSVSATTESKVTDNPADHLVEVLNNNRTANKQSSLYSNPGLACIALQYIKAYQGDCNALSGSNAKKPAESLFGELFAPNCGVDASTMKPITGRLLGCQTKYVQPSEAFSNVLIENEKSLSILYDKNHTEVGAAVSGSDGGSPYFWCVLFSNGRKNSSFAFEGGVIKTIRPGCFSGANDQCSSGHNLGNMRHLFHYVGSILIAVGFLFGL